MSTVGRGPLGTALTGTGLLTPPVWSDTPSLSSLTLPAISTAASGNIFKGANRFIHNFADATALGVNTFLGLNAGNFTMSPWGGANTLASYNTGVGGGALSGLTTGYGNTAVGGSALNSVTTGFFNVAVGVDSMAFTTITGSNNVAVGGDSLYSLTSATVNTGVGTRVLWNIQDGSENVAVGFDALFTDVSGAQNVAVGNQALRLATGSRNIAIGYNAGANLTTGAQNLFVGYNLAADSPTADYQLNIGGVIKGNLQSGVVLFPFAAMYGTGLDPATGLVRLGNAGAIAWSNANSNGMGSLAFDAFDRFAFVSTPATLSITNSVTNAATKNGKVVVPHYTNSEEPLGVIWGSSDSGGASVFIGGGTSAVNAAMNIHFYTASNEITTTGTRRMQIDSTGGITISGLAGVGTRAIGVDANGKLVVL